MVDQKRRVKAPIAREGFFARNNREKWEKRAKQVGESLER